MKRYLVFPNIEAERARNGLTIPDLCRELGVSQKTFYNWYKIGKIPIKKLIKLADLFNVSADYLSEHHKDWKGE